MGSIYADCVEEGFFFFKHLQQSWDRFYNFCFVIESKEAQTEIIQLNLWFNTKGLNMQQTGWSVCHREEHNPILHGRAEVLLWDHAKQCKDMLYGDMRKAPSS